MRGQNPTHTSYVYCTKSIFHWLFVGFLISFVSLRHVGKKLLSGRRAAIFFHAQQNNRSSLKVFDAVARETAASFILSFFSLSNALFFLGVFCFTFKKKATHKNRWRVFFFAENRAPPLGRRDTVPKRANFDSKHFPVCDHAPN